ncbi:MAG: hypothetical protein DHS80DRAFT_28698 [Piptocephalis tieghemiana]|nr:MAG: hypothetical protein DHS80DRAFT_28698 [Piptocephalis tieghemiana]
MNTYLSLATLAMLGLLGSSVLADISITKPVEGTTYEAGGTADIHWQTLSPSPDGKVNFDLVSGPPTQLTVVSPIGATTEDDGTINWNIPKDITPGSEYSIRAGSSAENYRYSHYFTITAPSEGSGERAATEERTGKGPAHKSAQDYGQWHDGDTDHSDDDDDYYGNTDDEEW